MVILLSERAVNFLTVRPFTVLPKIRVTCRYVIAPAMNAPPRKIAIAVLTAGALFGAGVLTGQRLSKEGFANAGVTSRDDVERNAISENPYRRAASAVASQISAQEAVVETARQEMLEAMKKNGVADSVRIAEHQHTLEREVLKLSVQLKMLKSLNGDEFFSAAIEMGLAGATIQKLYSEYRTEITYLSALPASGFGRQHPKSRMLKESTALKSAQLEAAAERLEASLSQQIEVTKRMIEASNVTPNGSSGDNAADDQVQGEYLAARNRYESQFHLLVSLREQATRQTGKQRVPEHPMLEPNRTDK